MSLDTNIDDLTQILSEQQLQYIIDRVSQLVSGEVRLRVTNQAINEEIFNQVRAAVSDALVHYEYPATRNDNYDANSLINGIIVEFKSSTQRFLDTLVSRMQTDVMQQVNAKLNAAEFADIIRDHTNQTVNAIVKQNQWQFPNKSIPSLAVDTSHLYISANNIVDGCVKNFESTGIQDLATATKVVVSDSATVFENRVVAKDFEVTGDFNVIGTVSNSLVDRISDLTLTKIESLLPDGSFKYADIDKEQLMSLLVQSISATVRHEVAAQIAAQTDADDVRSRLQSHIEQVVRDSIAHYQWPNSSINPNRYDQSIVGGIASEFVQQTRNYLDTLIKFVQEHVVIEIYNTVSNLEIRSLVVEQTNLVVNENLRHGRFQFPNQSIPASAVQTDDIYVPGHRITPGIIREFESTGIQDHASATQLVILDQATVVENTLVTKDLEIAGNLRLLGDIDPEFLNRIANHTKSVIESNYNEGTYDQYCNRVMEKLGLEGIAATAVHIADGPIIDEHNVLNSRITQTNIQKVGVLRELQVQGESLLDQTLYVSNKRMGLNTLDPERAFDMWDQEVQIVAGKRSKDVGIIGTARNQDLILSSNNRYNLILKPDGSVVAEQLTIGRNVHTSATNAPVDNRPMGTIVWNEQPTIGSPIGWVSLGGARWAKFGTITE